jgi:hypothetical protein
MKGFTMTANELYKLLDQHGVDYEVTEIFEGVRYVRVVIDEPLDEWEVRYCGLNQWVIFNKSTGEEWKDENNDFLCFDSEDEAKKYLNDLSINETRIS